MWRPFLSTLSQLWWQSLVTFMSLIWSTKFWVLVMWCGDRPTKRSKYLGRVLGRRLYRLRTQYYSLWVWHVLVQIYFWKSVKSRNRWPRWRQWRSEDVRGPWTKDSPGPLPIFHNLVPLIPPPHTPLPRLYTCLSQLYDFKYDTY